MSAISHLRLIYTACRHKSLASQHPLKPGGKSISASLPAPSPPKAQNERDFHLPLVSLRHIAPESRKHINSRRPALLAFVSKILLRALKNTLWEDILFLVVQISRTSGNTTSTSLPATSPPEAENERDFHLRLIVSAASRTGIPKSASSHVPRHY
jgi:hypothetical protein